jgi:16S rRNA (cytidine1402-2'-O)-methyltransferase
MQGVLYVVSTPIGNLGDLTKRAESTIKEVDFIVAENKERAKKLLNYLGVKKRILTVNTYSEKRRAKEIVRRIKNGSSCALISSAGTPCLSDPGHILVSRCLEEKIEVRVVPGPSALTSAIAVSGIHMDRFFFYGFLPQKKAKKRKVLKELSHFPYPIVFFESPRRIKETLSEIREIFGQRRIALLKEMTKIHENVIRADTETIFDLLEKVEISGEFTIIVDRPET